ncbi:MAG: hypothetical protein NDI62_00505 [Burkholderiales bacterium]|nr:hypothetical protein [Burkholderiales bacterium]
MEGREILKKFNEEIDPETEERPVFNYTANNGEKLECHLVNGKWRYKGALGILHPIAEEKQELLNREYEKSKNS